MSIPAFQKSYPPLTIATPWYRLVPKTLRENIEFRRKVIGLGDRSESEAAAIRKMCQEDVLFWWNTFFWTYDPRRKPGLRWLPFITYPFQDNAISRLMDAIGVRDFLLKKCRAVGGSYMVLGCYDYLATFGRDNSFLLVSQIADKVDKAEDPDCLFFKLDKAHERMPDWIAPVITKRNLMLMVYGETDCVVSGAATTGNAGLGGRRTSAFIDEAAHIADDEPGKDYHMMRALRGVTDSRILVSSPFGPANMFAEEYRKDTLDKLDIDWYEHPEWSKGLTIKPDGEPTSPWLVKELGRCASPVEAKSEIFAQFVGSSENYFPNRDIDTCIERDALPPMHVGRLGFNYESAMPTEFMESEEGNLCLWCDLDDLGNPPDGSYVAGADIATGTPDATGRGASNSVLVIYERYRREKVAEFVISSLSANQFARASVALMRWFSPTRGDDSVFLIWEANGPGRDFGKEIIAMEFGNFWWKRQEDRIDKPLTQVPGWWSTPQTKSDAFGNYRSMLVTGRITNRSRLALVECREYIYGPGLDILHQRSAMSNSPTEGRQRHGDRVVADAMAAWVLGEEKDEPTEAKPAPSEHCPAARRKEAAEEKDAWAVVGESV